MAPVVAGRRGRGRAGARAETPKSLLTDVRKLNFYTYGRGEEGGEGCPERLGQL